MKNIICQIPIVKIKLTRYIPQALIDHLFICENLISKSSIDNRIGIKYKTKSTFKLFTTPSLNFKLLDLLQYLQLIVKALLFDF